jgi:hypothetical protein
MAMNAPRSLHNIAGEVMADWPNPYFGAVPYLNAMRHIETINDRYGEDDGRTIVIYFLSNAKTWRGETAKRVKAELKGLLK